MPAEISESSENVNSRNITLYSDKPEADIHCLQNSTKACRDRLWGEPENISEEKAYKGQDKAYFIGLQFEAQFNE